VLNGRFFHDFKISNYKRNQLFIFSFFLNSFLVSSIYWWLVMERTFPFASTVIRLRLKSDLRLRKQKENQPLVAERSYYIEAHVECSPCWGGHSIPNGRRLLRPLLIKVTKSMCCLGRNNRSRIRSRPQEFTFPTCLAPSILDYITIQMLFDSFL
jgi:hypothetical protein